MSEEAKKVKSERKKRKSRSKEIEYGSYVIAIEDWDWALSFGVDQTRYRKGPYMDFRHLHLVGKLVVPSRIKAETAQAILMPERIPNERDAPEPKGVGSVSVFRGRFEALLGMPDDALAPVLQMLIANRFRFIDLHGERMRYRSATIRSYRLEMDIDEEDMPDW